VLSDAVLMRTLEESLRREKHAVIALVEHGELRESYVSPNRPVISGISRSNAVRQAFDAYDIADGVCLLIVRDNKAVISLNALR